MLEGNGPALLSAKHGHSVVHLYKAQCKIRREQSSAIVDTGAQRGATPHPSETLASTGEILSIQPAVVAQQKMKRIHLGAETVTVHGKPIILVVPDISVFSPELADPLVPAGRLMEAGFDVVFRNPKQAVADGFHDFLLYGGTMITPEGETIVMEYAKHTWRLPMPGNSVARAITKNRVETLNSFECLTDRDVENEIPRKIVRTAAPIVLNKKRPACRHGPHIHHTCIALFSPPLLLPFSPPPFPLP